MSNFAIIRHIKIKGAEAFNGISAEADRTISGKNVDKSRTSKNIVIQKSKYANFDDFVNTKKSEIALANKATKQWNIENPSDKQKLRRFPRMTENRKTKEKELLSLNQQFVFTYSNGALSEEQGVEMLKRSDQFIRNWFLKNEIISSNLHLDETTPHIHVDVAYYDKHEKRFNQKELSAQGKTDIDAIRNAFQREVADEFGLIKQDGSVVAEHDGGKADIGKGQLKAENKKLKEQIVQKNKHLKSTINELRQKLDDAAELADNQDMLIQSLENQEPTTEEIQNAEFEHNGKSTTAKELVKDLKKEVTEFRKKSEEQERKIGLLEGTINTLKDKVSVFKSMIKSLLSSKLQSIVDMPKAEQKKGAKGLTGDLEFEENSINNSIRKDSPSR